MYLSIFFCISVTATRGFIRQKNELEISLFPKVKVGRSLALERYLLNQPQGVQNGPSKSRRSTPAQALRVCKNVPIGARGRKRKIIQYIGCAPNPDGRQLKQPVSSVPVRQQEPKSSVQRPANFNGRQNANEPTTSQPAKRTNARATSTPHASVLVNQLGSPFSQPAKRTYSRATSTPYASASHRPQDLSFALPDESLLNAGPNEPSLHVDFDETFGRLHYDSSDTDSNK